MFKFEGRERDYKAKIASLQENLTELTAKFENAKNEKQRIEKIADDRNFELQTIRNDTDIVALKTYYRELERNMILAINEKQPQIDACQKLINAMKKIIPEKSKKNDSPKLLKIRHRRKKKTEEVEERKEENLPDVILVGKKQKAKISPVETLIEYLYENYSNLFVVSSGEKDMMMLEKEQVLKVLDEIPDELIEK